MNIGILIFVDDSSQMLQEFFWLYKSLIYSGAIENCTIIAVCHPQVAEHLSAWDRVIVIPAEPYVNRHVDWSGYPYINSIGNLCEKDVLAVCRQFDFILKTDCDTFVTPAFRKFTPTGLCFGFGAYAYEESVRRKLVECSERWGFAHAGLHNVGASVLGPTDMVLNFLLAQLDCCQKLLNEEFKTDAGQWPGWCKNVLTMYAGELALRRTYPQQCSLGFLDHFPVETRKLGSDVLHIHAWHTSAYFSKHEFRAGQYSTMDLDAIDKGTLAGYCHWLAAADMETVRRCSSSANRP